MSPALLVALLLCAAEPPLTDSQSGPAPTDRVVERVAETRTLSQSERIAALRAEIRAALAETARFDQVVFDRDIPRLVGCYKQLDPQLLSLTELRRQRSLIRSRLTHWQRALEARLKQARIPRPASPATETAAKPVDPSPAPAGPQAPQQVTRQAPQQTQTFAQAPPGGAANAGGNGAGGNGAGGNGGGNGLQSQINARGWELVDLIRTTIAPDSWDVNGGKGSIYFYPGLNALVVSQSPAVHEAVSGALGNIRR